MISFRQIRYFLAVAEAGNFSQAAGGLFIAQPALSRQIAALEATLGYALFVREARGVRLTPAGEVFRARAAGIEAALAVAVEDGRATERGEAGVLRLTHRQASLEELGQLHTPPLTKDAIAGRIRRLLATADRVAEATGVPGTEASLPADLRDPE